jgi:hypothetical protein
MTVLSAQEASAIMDEGFLDEAEAEKAEEMGLGARKPGFKKPNSATAETEDQVEKAQRSAKTISAFKETLSVTPDEAWDRLSTHVRQNTGGLLRDAERRAAYSSWVSSCLEADRCIAIDELDPSHDYIISEVRANEKIKVEHAPKMIQVVHKLSGVKAVSSDTKNAMRTVNRGLLHHLAEWSICMEGEETTPEAISETVEPMTLVS